MKKQQLSKNFSTKSATTVEEAIKVLKENVKGNFEHTFECQIALKLPEKNKKDSVRISVVPPHAFGKEVKILVLCDPQNSDIAKAAGADYVGLEDLVEKIVGGWSDFDIVIATPSVMPKIAKLGKILGPRGIMPNPKTETVTTDVEKVIKSYKGGKLDYKMAESNQISFKFGKFKMDDSQLMENFNTFMEALKVEVSKYTGKPISRMYIKTTMSPSIEINSKA